MRRRALTALALLAVAASPAAARTGKATDLHDARYCEFFAIKGALPHATAFVYNTIELGTCPAAWFKSIDTSDVAKQLGAALVVLNGPRHFLMDAANASVGRVITYKGQKLTNVATIALTDLDQSPYRDRKIGRTNTWTWKNGRSVFELVAPGGDTYVMQSYAQIVDPALTLAELGGLGGRLALPDGWHYRTRHLTRPLTLAAKGSATILQDDLKNTYQLATTTRPKGPRVQRSARLDGHTKNVSNANGVLEDRGTIAGTPFGKGTIDVTGHFADGRFEATFRLLFAHGSVTGTASLPFTTSGNEIDFRGPGTFTGGTGIYRGITGGSLDVHDHNTLDGQNGVVSLSGKATY
jgi:hypothetical protein